MQATLIASRRGALLGGQGSGDAERGLIAWFRNDIATAAMLMTKALRDASGTSDPLPAHILSTLSESRSSWRKSAAAPLIQAVLTDGREGAAKSFEFSNGSYKALLPIVERYTAADSDNAMIFLGDMCREGLGVSQDISRAVAMYSRPADNGDIYALGALGEIFETEAELKNESKAFSYYMSAALGGNPRAAAKLGDMYRDGRGTGRKNIEEAYVWYCVAMMGGDSDALGIVDEMDGKGLLKFRSVSPATSRRARERAFHIYHASLDVKPE